MNEAVIFESPIGPPVEFNYAGKFGLTVSWINDSRLSKITLVKKEYVGEPNSSSSHFVTLQNLIQTWSELQMYTTSSTSITDRIYNDILCAVSQAASVKVENASENLFEIRRKTGFTWSRLADLLNIDRRTLNNWASGATISKKNRWHLAKTLEVLRCADKGSAELNSAALNERRVQFEPSPFEAIRAGNYEYAKQRLFNGLPQPNYWQTVPGSVSRIGEFQPIVFHADADGTERITPLPHEPEKAARKKQIKQRLRA